MVKHDNVAMFLPTFNEELNVKEVISGIRENFEGVLFIVDGYSTDNTVRIAEELKVPVFSRDAPGKGAAIRAALQIADELGKDFLLFMDCDSTYDAGDIEHMLYNIESYDLVIGTRPLSLVHTPFRRLGNKIATAIINLPFKGKIKDSISGFKCMRVKRFKHLIVEDGFVADALICLFALRDQMKIKLVPIKSYERKGQSKMGFWVGMLELVKLIAAIVSATIYSRKNKVSLTKQK
jgi:dolichol-phosphate hexosyltransferase